MPDEFRIRRGTPDDLDIVMHHRIAMFRDMGSTEKQLGAVEVNSKQSFAKSLAEGTYLAWFIEDASGRVVAGAGITLLEHHPGPRDPQPRRPYVDNVYTEPEFRKRGFARRLMEELIAWCREQRYPSLSLHASEFGRAIYASLGFEPTNEMRFRFD